MDDGKDWAKYADRVNPHFRAALTRCVDHGVPVDDAAFLGLIFFAGAVSATFGAETSLREILILRKATDDAFAALAAAAVDREVSGKGGTSARG